MKKLALFALVLGAVSFTSCKKNYTCDCGDGYVTKYEDPGTIEKEVYESACTTSGCTWSQD